MARVPGADFDAVLAANRKQAMVPAGADIRDPVGTAPGVVVPAGAEQPGIPDHRGAARPPRELQPMWSTALANAAVQRAIAGRTEYRQRTVRMFGLAESGLAETLARGRDRGGRVRPAGDHHLPAAAGELEIVTRYEPAGGAGVTTR